MGVYESEWLQPEPARNVGEAWFRRLAVVALILFLVYLGATLAGVSRETLSLIFSIVVMPLPVIVWWAYVRAPQHLRRTVWLCAWAATLWLGGSLVWYGFFVADGSTVPPSPGVWDTLFVAARLLLIAAVVVAMRSLVSVRIALLDACVIVAAGVALGAAFIGRGLEENTSVSTLLTLNRPLLSIVTLMLIASAALASLEGVPRSVVLLGIGEVGLTIGSLIYSYSAVQGDFVDDRWANLAWAVGAGFSMLAAFVIIFGIDRPVAAASTRRLPGHRSGSRAVLLVTLAAIALVLGVVLYGILTGRETVALTGLCASVVIAAAMALRARDSISTAEFASELLDNALAESEVIRDELHETNVRMQRANVDLRMLQIVVSQGFDLLDERTNGRLRDLLEEAGDELVALIDESSVNPLDR